MQKVIGLDIGSFSIKAIEIINTFKSYEVVNFYETVIPALEGVPLDAVVPVCMEQLFQENNIQADRIITAMPGQFISSRIIPFNFSDPRKIEASITVQLEDYVPFNMDDMIIDHQILGNVRGQTMVLAVMTRKAFLKNFLELLSRINIDPKLIDIDSLAFYNLSTHIDMGRSQSFSVVDIGHEKTSVCIISDGVLRMARTINLGGRYITDFLARDLECDFFEAQRVKHRVSRVLTREGGAENIEEDDREIIERITLATNAIVKELGRTFYAYKSWDKQPLDRIYLSGGSSRIQHLDQLLSEQLDLEVQKVSLDQTELKLSPNVSEKMSSIPQGLSIGMRAVTNVKKHSQINLRRGEFSYVQNYESILKAGTIAFKVISVALSLLVVSYVVKYYFYMNQLDKLTKAYVSVYKKEFPRAKTKDVPFSKIRRDAETKMKQGLIENRAAIADFQQANLGSPALQLVQAISEEIPKDLLIDVTLFDFKSTLPGEGKLTFKAETDGFESVAKVVDILKAIPSLQDVTEKNSATKPGTEGKKIEFTILAAYQSVE